MTDNIKSSSPTAPSRSTSTTSSSTTSSAAPVALPSDEALELLLSPDGYYTYLSIPKPDPSSSLTNPYLDAENSIIDLDQVKKNYRRLSLKHHPDRRGGNEETFRALNRAKIVLSSPKLRREYDLIGLDLEDDAEDHHDDHHASSENASGDASKTENEDKEHSNNNNQNKTETVMSHLASATLAGVLQMVVRTALMGVVSVLLSRYTILTIVTLGMLVFLSTRIYSALNVAAKGANVKLNLLSLKDVGVPLLIAVGVFSMFRGRRFVMENDISGGEDNQVIGDSTTVQETIYHSWTWTFWFGETLVMTLFIANSFEKRSPALLALFTTISGIFALWLRGQFWRYATLLGFQGVIALLVVLAFPIMEMILEQIVEEKMKKVGEKIRAHDARLRELQRKRNVGAAAASLD
uniref:J domain-containing protein n=1 Tax=Skeletonema marinoi TaxID=267567 RepID=A0A7S2KKY3_9STRA